VLEGCGLFLGFIRPRSTLSGNGIKSLLDLDRFLQGILKKEGFPNGADLSALVRWGRRITDFASVITISRLLRTAFALALHEREIARRSTT
jgi:hypothetical protein